MSEPSGAAEPADSADRPVSGVFTPQYSRFNSRAPIAVLLGRCYSSAQLLEVRAALTYIERYGIRDMESITWSAVGEMREAVRTTRLIDALNRGRKWARVSLAARLSSMLERDIAVAVVPSHDPWATDTPMRQLARELVSVVTVAPGAAEEGSVGGAGSIGRIDATDCLIRHTKIVRIVFGGPSTPSLHRRTIRCECGEKIAGHRVLLLDDIAKSGQSLLACRAMLYEAGASHVQAAALGRVIGGETITPPAAPDKQF